MTSLTTKPDWTPGPMGRHVDELARVTASPKGWIYTPASPNESQIEVIKALRQLDSKQTALTDAGTPPTFSAAFTASAFTGGILSTLVVGVAGTGYATVDSNIGVTVDATGQITPGTAHAVSDTFGLVDSFVIDTAGSYNAFPGVTVAAGAGTQATGILTMDITGFTVTAAGSGYGADLTDIPVTLSGGGAGTQATAHAVSDAGGTIISVVLDTPGSGYTSLPTIEIGGAGTLATATGLYDLASIAVNNAGTGYGVVNTNVPVTVSSGNPDTAATAHATSDVYGVLDAFVIDTAGAGYQFVPTITVGGTGTAGTGTPSISAMNVATGAVLKVTLTASEAVTVAGTPSILVDIGTETRSFVYDSGLSDSTHLVFKYTVVVADAALVTELISGATVTFGTYDGIGDVLAATGGTNWLASVAFTAPTTTNISVN